MNAHQAKYGALIDACFRKTGPTLRDICNRMVTTAVLVRTLQGFRAKSRKGGPGRENAWSQSDDADALPAGARLGSI
jgi:hypothetical protein